MGKLGRSFPFLPRLYMGLDRRLLLVAGLFLPLSGCMSIHRVTFSTDGAPGDGELETLRGVTVENDGLTLKVASAGCTTKADFVFFVERDGHGSTVAFARKKLDACKGVPFLVDFRFSYQELGLSKDTNIRVLNPVASRRAALTKPSA